MNPEERRAARHRGQRRKYQCHLMTKWTNRFRFPWAYLSTVDQQASVSLGLHVNRVSVKETIWACQWQQPAGATWQRQSDRDATKAGERIEHDHGLNICLLDWRCRLELLK